MSKVLKRELAWLARDTPGFNVFQPTEAQLKTKAQETKGEYHSPSRRIAHRGTEVFVAVGTEIRWSDLALMRDAGEDPSSGQEKSLDRVSRVLQTSVSRPIRQLSVSLSGDFLAIVTDHTCHVAVLPSSAHLRSGEREPIRVRSFQIGPTAHVVEKAPLVSAIWHPLSPSGNCLITVTQDSCVRMWDLDRDNRDSFGTSSLAVDLRKLSNAASQLDNFSTSTWGTNTGYSPDAEEMQVAGACFGGQGLDDEHGWSSMTLWVAMTEGGVYALCPFLPQKWRAPATMLPSLTTSVVSKSRAISRAKDVSDSERRVSEQQRRWLADVDDQDPITLPNENGLDTVEVYSRPERPGAIPKLQGPYYITPDSELGDITDIHVIAPKINDEELYDEDEFDAPDEEEALSVGLVCLSSSLGKVHVCLDLNAVEAEWLPSRRPRGFTSDDSAADNDLLLLHTINLGGPGGWPTLTPSPFDRYELFTTHLKGVHALSFRPWISHLETELTNPSDPGVGFRFDVLLENAPTAVTRVIKVQNGEAEVTSAVAVADPTEGIVVLTCAGAVPHSALLEPPVREDQFAPDEFISAGALPGPELRTAYQPHDFFFKPSGLARLVRDASEKRVLGSDLKSQVRFSSATLQLMTDAHRILSQETHDLGEAASELFVRINSMREELQEQIRRVREISQKVDDLMGHGDPDETGDGANVQGKIHSRIGQSKKKTVALNDRVDALRKKMLRLGGAPLSAREKAFASEVDALHNSVEDGDEANKKTDALAKMDDSQELGQGERLEQDASLTRRLEAASDLRETLLSQVNEAVKSMEKDGQSENRRSTLSGGHFRRQKIEEVWQMLEVETALVEAVKERLEKLS